MNKRILSILCCLTLLMSCISGLGVIAETTAAQQACVTGATLTAINSATDAALLPTDDNLIAGKSLLSGSSDSSGVDLKHLYDGLYQGINQDIVYKKNPDGTWYQPNSQYPTVGSNVGDTRYVCGITQEATATALGYAQLGFNLGTTTQIESFAIGSTAEGANSSINNDQFKDPNFDGVETAFTKDTRLHMMDVYVSNSMDALYDDASKVITIDYLNGNIDGLDSSQAPIAGIYTLNTAAVGQYVGFRFYVAGNNDETVATTYNGHTAKWGWWGQVRISELAAFGEQDRVSVDSPDDLPNVTSLIAGKIPTNADGNEISLSSGSLDQLTDGKVQGINQDVNFVLTQEDQYKTDTTDNKTYYSYIAPKSLVEAQGLDSTQTWYIRPNYTQWQYTDVESTRAVFTSPNHSKPVYDLGKAGRIDSILLASSTELTGKTNRTYYDASEDYDASRHEILTDADIEAMSAPETNDGRMLWTAKVYVGNTVNVFEEGKLVLEYDLSGNYAEALCNLWTLRESAHGRYVGFDFTDCVMDDSNKLIRVSELAVYGSTETQVSTFNTDNYPNYVIAADKNLLADRVADKSAPDADLPDLLFDGKMSGMNVAYANGQTAGVPATCWEPALNTDEYLWLTFDMGVKQDIYSFQLAGSGKNADGVESIDLYVGSNTHTSIQAKDVQPDWSYDGNVTFGIRADFAGPLTGRYVVLRLKAKNSENNNQLWVSEIAAVGEEAPNTKKKTKKIVCVGDSITNGTVFPGVDDWNAQTLKNHYPLQLERLLDDYDLDTDYQVVNAGIAGSAVIGIDQIIPGTDTNFPGNGNGAPTTWLVEQEKDTYKEENKCVQQADTLLIMLGTNDAGAASYWEAREPYYVEYYKKVIDAFRAVSPDVEIYVLTAPYTSVDTHYENLRDGVVPLQKKMAAEWGLPVIDVWEATRHHVEDLNNGDLASFIDDVDMENGLKVHPDEEGAAVIAQACFDALTGAENDMYMVKANGGQVRGYEGGVPTGDMALRFSMTLPAVGITQGENYATKLTADSKITIAGKEYTVTGLGAVVGVEALIDNPQIDLVAGLDKGYAKDVPAQKLYEADENSATFTVVVTNVDEANYGSNLVARGYVQYRDGDVTRYAYGPVVTRNVSQVIAAHTMEQLNPTFDTWQGYQRMTFTAGGVECYLVIPDQPAEGNPWLWRTEFWEAFADTDLEMLDAGWYLAYCRVSDRYGDPVSVDRMKQFYDAAVPLANLDRQAVLMGLSRGGLYAVNYAATHPDTVAGLYLDAPVQDICSWPGSLYSDNLGNFDNWQQCKDIYGFASDEEALADKSASPRWKYHILLENNIPVLLVYGTQDQTVPFSENGQLLVDAYTTAGKTDLLKVQSFERDHHPHGWVNGASAYIIANMNK